MKLFNTSKHYTIVRYKERGLGPDEGLVRPLTEFECSDALAKGYLEKYKGKVVVAGSPRHLEVLKYYGMEPKKSVEPKKVAPKPGKDEPNNIA